MCVCVCVARNPSYSHNDEMGNDSSSAEHFK